MTLSRSTTSTISISIVTLLIAACTSFGSGTNPDPSSSSGGSSSGGALADGGEVEGGGGIDPDGGGPEPVLPGCRSRSYGDIIPITLLGNAEITSFRLTGQGPRFNAYVATSPELKIGTYTVSAEGQSMSAIQPLNIPLGPTIQNHPFVTDGELTLFFQGRDNAQAPQRIWKSTRTAAADAWGDAMQLGQIGGEGDVLEPYFAGSALYFGLAIASGPEKIAKVARSGQLFSASVETISEINGDPGDHNAFPVVSDDELEIFFMSRRTGGGDIYRAARASKSDKFSRPKLLSNLSQPGTEERPSFLSEDGCTLFITVRSGGSFTLGRAVR